MIDQLPPLVGNGQHGILFVIHRFPQVVVKNVTGELQIPVCLLLEGQLVQREFSLLLCLLKGTLFPIKIQHQGLPVTVLHRDLGDRIGGRFAKLQIDGFAFGIVAVAFAEVIVVDRISADTVVAAVSVIPEAEHLGTGFCLPLPLYVHKGKRRKVAAFRCLMGAPRKDQQSSTQHPKQAFLHGVLLPHFYCHQYSTDLPAGQPPGIWVCNRVANLLSSVV